MVTGEINRITLVPSSRPVRTLVHELVVNVGRRGRHPQACPKDASGILRPHIIDDGSREHPTEISTTGAPLEPHLLPIDDPTLER